MGDLGVAALLCASDAERYYHAQVDGVPLNAYMLHNLVHVASFVLETHFYATSSIPCKLDAFPPFSV
jgi:hypothetical protein